MALTKQNFDMYAGDTKDIVVTVIKDGTTTPIDLGGSTIKWVAARGTNIVISKESSLNGITLTDPINGVFTVRLDHLDTKIIVGTLNHEALLIDVFGNESTVMVGTLKILPTLI